jgi:CubicO group peptidase (beta-lactamase class C family)
MRWRTIAGAAAATLVAGAVSAEPVARDKVAAALPQLEAMAAKLVADGAVPGIAIAVVHDDAVVYLGGFGVREVGKPETVDADTVFQIASMSKPISATVVAALIGEELLDWGTKVADLEPAFALDDPYPSGQMTVRDLFNHRSGLPGSSGDDLEEIGFDRAHIMRQLRLVPPSSSFRAGYAYSNAGLTMGALAAAAPTGQDWETVAEERLFEPLGMASTSYRYADFTGHVNAASLHVPVDGSWTALVKRDATPQAPAGSVSSSVRDLAQWMRLVLGNGSFEGQELIPASAIAPTHVPLTYLGDNPITGTPVFYGLGWNVEYGRNGLGWAHNGAFSAGTRSLVVLLPESQLGILVLTNAFPSGAPEAMASSFLDLVFQGEVAQDYLPLFNARYAGMFGPAIEAAKATYARPPQPPTPALPDSAYAGTYANAYVGDAVVAAEGGALTVRVGPDGVTSWPLTHFDRDLFLYYPDAEMPAARFTVGPDGKATALTLESLDSNGLGTLTLQP